MSTRVLELSFAQSDGHECGVSSCSNAMNDKLVEAVIATVELRKLPGHRCDAIRSFLQQSTSPVETPGAKQCNFSLAIDAFLTLSA